uniref:Uncharacterized protein n=1 Tax=Romanomermis culicivorax TaxID=13658 RepID=A0A915I173_ROMCU
MASWRKHYNIPAPIEEEVPWMVMNIVCPTLRCWHVDFDTIGSLLGTLEMINRVPPNFPTGNHKN